MYIGPKSRTERPRKTKIGTEVAHVTRDSDTTFKVKWSKVKVTRPLWLVVLARQHGHTVMVTYPYAYRTVDVYRVTCTCRPGAYRGGLPPTACYDSIATFCLYKDKRSAKKAQLRNPLTRGMHDSKLERHSIQRIPLPRQSM